MSPFDRAQWNKNIKLSEHWPHWLCSECLKGYLYPEKKDKSEENILIAESSEIKYLRDNDPGLDVDNYYNHSVIKLECNNPKCLSESLLVGKTTSKEYYYEDESGSHQGYTDCFEPIFFTIPPQIINIPKNKFDGYDKFLYQSFKIFFDDPSSAANKIRIFLEHLAPNTNNERKSIHARLRSKFEQTYPDAYKLLIACKWIGNDGSHEGDITHEDILDSYEFIELALVILYPRETSNSLQKATNINDKEKSLSKINP